MRKLASLGIVGLLFVLIVPGVEGQWATNALLDNGRHKLLFSVSGQYVELDWPAKRLQTFDRQAGVQLGVAIAPWLKIAGSVGYSQMDFRRTHEIEFRFDPDYHWGAGLFLGPIFIYHQTLALNLAAGGNWFNPYGKKIKETFGSENNYTTRNEFILEHLVGYTAFNVLLRWKRLDLYAGPLFSVEKWRIRSRELLEGSNFSYSINNRSEEFFSDLLNGVSAGVGLRLPGRYYLNIEFRQNPLRDAIVVLSFAQFGAPN